MPKLIQINLCHCKAASAAPMIKVIKDVIEIVLVQEPRINEKLNIFLLANECDANKAAASIEVTN